jgi:hypothetical protein
MVPELLGQADLRLPHSFRTALSAAVEKEDDRPLLVIVTPPFFRQIDLVAIGGTIDLNSAIEKSGFLRWDAGLLRSPRSVQKGGRQPPRDAEEGRDKSQVAVHTLESS